MGRIDHFAENYLGKLYYFCLKKTGSAGEAEDLSADIALCVAAELKKGVAPTHFSAWVWKIARNRYAAWAARKSKARENFSCENMDEMQFAGSACLESAHIHSEDLGLLRRELAFISRDYREIVVAYYISDQKVKTIAENLCIPMNTVMSKLFRARKILREGMKMAREFGARSYKPENVHFLASGSQPSGWPWRGVDRQLPKNILLEAHNNPSTVQELAVELGIAMPYMEEEVRLLVEGELLAQVNGKYVTNFLIACKECQLEIYNAQRKDAKERSRLLDTIVNDCLPDIRGLGIAGSHISDNTLKWLIITLMVDSFNVKVWKYSPFKRKDGGNWGFTGFEEHSGITENLTCAHNGCKGVNSGFDIWIYNYFGFPGARDGNFSYPFDYRFNAFIADIYNNKRNIKTFTDTEKEMWETISGNGHYIGAGENGEAVFHFPIFKAGDMARMFGIIRAHAIYPHLEEAFNKLTAEVKGHIAKYATPVIVDTLDYYAAIFMFGIRMMTINELTASGRLAVPENMSQTTIGLYGEFVKEE